MIDVFVNQKIVIQVTQGTKLEIAALNQRLAAEEVIVQKLAKEGEQSIPGTPLSRH